MLTAFTVLLFTTGCKKKEDTLTLPLTGTWQPLNDTTYTYLVFENSQTFRVLKEGLYGVHSSSQDVYTADETQITFAPPGEGTELFNYTISNDSLYITNTHVYLVLRKTAPVNVDTWSGKIVETESHSLGSGLRFGSMEWDGSNFLISSAYANLMYKVNPVTYQIVDSAGVSQNAVGLTTIAGNIWVNDYPTSKKLYHIDYTTGFTLANSGDCTDKPVCLASEGNNILLFTDNGDLYQYNTLTNAYILITSMPGFLGGTVSSILAPDMVIQGNNAYISFANIILKLDLTTYLVTNTYFLTTGEFITGLTLKGSDFYVLTVNGFSAVADINPKLHKIQLQ